MSSTALQSRTGPLTGYRVDRAVALLLAGASMANGACMLVDPMTWYGVVPGVTDTGPANTHFIRDIGIAFCAAAVALAWGALRPVLATALYATAMVFLGLHGGLHFIEYLHHGVPMHSLASDLAGVALPALLSLILTLRAAIHDKETRP